MEVVVIGASPFGLYAACALASAEVKTCVLEENSDMWRGPVASCDEGLARRIGLGSSRKPLTTETLLARARLLGAEVRFGCPPRGVPRCQFVVGRERDFASTLDVCWRIAFALKFGKNLLGTEVKHASRFRHAVGTRFPRDISRLPLHAFCLVAFDGRDPRDAVATPQLRACDELDVRVVSLPGGEREDAVLKRWRRHHRRPDAIILRPDNLIFAAVKVEHLHEAVDALFRVIKKGKDHQYRTW